METAVVHSWPEANQRYLAAALADVRAALQRHAAPDGEAPEALRTAETRAEIAGQTEALPALERLCQTFDLSAFERDVLLLCAGVELEASFAALCADAHDDPQRAYPTFGLALAALPEAHWNALSPTAALRRWRLVEVRPSGTLATSPLRIDERILHFLTGLHPLDENLFGFVLPVPVEDALLVPSHRQVAEQIAATWTQETTVGRLPVIQLCGIEAAGKRVLAAAACARLGLGLYRMPATVLPDGPHEFDSLLRLWERESALSTSALLLDADDLDADDADRQRRLRRFVEEAGGPLLVASRERLHLPHRPVVTFDVKKPTRREQQTLWERGLGARAAALNGQVDQLTAQFDLSAPSIRAACAHTLGQASQDRSEDLEPALWAACRVQARRQLAGMARCIEPVATWDDLVLPEPQRQVLHEVSAQVRHRLRVYETWGFAARSSRGLGITALFAGPSGTGKTLAAEVLAHALHLDLYHIDLSQVVSKYIGETEKNLGRVFDAAEEGGAVLLFDEADALFGKRSEVKDSHDRYANIEVSYLLQRMEAYRGLAILTTNMKGALDDAFQRRIRFAITFPFPDAAQRAEIWRRIFPPETPTRGLDAQKLARLNATGGTIRNIALHAAFLAAEAREPVHMAHVLHAARRVYAKLEKPLTDNETRGWV